VKILTYPKPSLRGGAAVEAALAMTTKSGRKSGISRIGIVFFELPKDFLFADQYLNPERMQMQGFKDNYDYASDMLAAANGTRAENLRPKRRGPVSTGVTLCALNDFFSVADGRRDPDSGCNASISRLCGADLTAGR
jgi:hypothetical protein